MWQKVKSLFAGDSADAAPLNIRSDQTVLQYMNDTGRVSLQTLERAAATMDVVTFEQFLCGPILVGAGVREGRILDRSAMAEPTTRKKTQLFIPRALIESAFKNSDSLRRALYPIIPRSQTTASGRMVTLEIGRVAAGNEIVVPDFAVSQKHARIRIQGKRYEIEDLRSTNGTQVNGSRISGVVKLREGDKVQFGRYEFDFTSPPALYALLAPHDE